MSKRHIVILGAGISGLATAWFLKQKYADRIDITLLEKASRVGGWIQTIQKDGFLFELGPHSCRANDASRATLQLIEELGLQDQVITPHACAKTRFLYTNQRLQQLPTSLFSSLFSPLMRGVPAALLRDWWTPHGNGQDETIYSFISRRFGHKIAEQFMDPLVSGIYAGDIRKLSIQSCFPQLMQWEQEHGNLLGGMFAKKLQVNENSSFIQDMQKHAMFSLKQGMESLPQALAKSLGKFVRTSSGVGSINFLPEKVELGLETKEILQADHVFSTISAAAFSSLMTQKNSTLAAKLKKGENASVAVVNLGYQQDVLKHSGFGYLVPSSEGEEILGVIWDSSVFPQQNHNPKQTRLTVMLGGAHHPNLCAESEEQILERAIQSIKKHLGIHLAPNGYHISVAHKAIPQYEVGHQANMGTLMHDLKHVSSRITLLGSSFYGVSINDCIAQAKKVVDVFPI